MIQTYWCPGPWPWQWANMCTREVPDPPPDPCAIPACVKAQADLANSRGRFNSNCTALQVLNFVIGALKQILSTPVWIVIAMAIIAAILTAVGAIAIALVVWALIALYGLSWYLVIVLGKTAQPLAEALAKAAQDVAVAIQAVIRDCPEQCRGDLSTPHCKFD